MFKLKCVLVEEGQFAFQARLFLEFPCTRDAILERRFVKFVISQNEEYPLKASCLLFQEGEIANGIDQATNVSGENEIGRFAFKVEIEVLLADFEV